MAITVFPAPPGTAQGPYYQADDVALVLGLFGGTYWSIDAGVVEGAEDELSADISGPSLVIGAGRAIVNGRFFVNTEAKTFQPANPPRIDTTTKRIVLEVAWDVEHVGGIGTYLMLLEGNDGIQIAPPLTQVPGVKYQIPLWTFNVGTDGVITNLIDERSFAVPNLPIDGDTASVTVPNAMVAWAIVDLQAGDGPVLVDSYGEIEIYDHYVNTGSTSGNQEYEIYIYGKLPAHDDGMTLYTTAYTIDGDLGDMDGISRFYTQPQEFTTPASLTPPDAPWGALTSSMKLTTQVTNASTSTHHATIVNDAGRILITVWGIQP